MRHLSKSGLLGISILFGLYYIHFNPIQRIWNNDYSFLEVTLILTSIYYLRKSNLLPDITMYMFIYILYINFF